MLGMHRGDFRGTARPRISLRRSERLVFVQVFRPWTFPPLAVAAVPPSRIRPSARSRRGPDICMRQGHQAAIMREMAVAAYGVPAFVTWPAAASSAATSRSDRLRLLMVYRASFLASATVSGLRSV
jgi:hypothetical protein